MNEQTGAADIRSVMVVDNDPAVLAFMTMLLEREGMSVSTAEDGLAALSMLESIHPDLMMIDLVMPNIGGDKLGKILRSQARFSDTYLIMISAISPEEDIDYRAFGYDVCIAKGPFNKMGPIVLDVISRLGVTIKRGTPGGIFGRENLFKREITRELLSTKRHAELIIDNLAESIVETNRAGRIISANAAATHLFGIREENLLSSNFVELFQGEQRQEVASRIAYAAPRAPADVVTLRYRERLLTLQFLAVDDDGVISPIIIAEDVTELHRSQEELESLVAARTQELAQANEALQAEIDRRAVLEERLRSSIREKEAMLDEIHHRVKNNLQVVSSLLNLSAKRVADERARDVIDDTRRRIQSLALVHDKLYGAGDLAAVHAQQYFRTLVDGVVASLADSSCPVRTTVDARDVTVPIDIAVPCALITNELVTNALKHAFKGRSSGAVAVTLRVFEDDSYQLEVADDGVGFASGVSFEAADTLGFRIVKVLARQLGASIEVHPSNGTRFEVRIPSSTGVA